MNPKVANIIAIELGILILISGWFAFGHFQNPAPTAAPLAESPAADSFAPLTRSSAPVTKPLPDVPDAIIVNAPIDAAVEPPVPVVQVTDPTYVSEAYLTTQPESGYGGEEAPYYSEVISEPVSSDYLVAAPQPIYAYRPSTQIVVVSNVYAVDPRCRRAPRMENTPRTMPPGPVTPARMPTVPQGNVVSAPPPGGVTGGGRRGGGSDVVTRPKTNPNPRPGPPVKAKWQP